ncbi:hypothetical protein P167DRAFT_532366 [Morchella conica CCBAS932]|uniref:Uncharacterized protein n=1 Tax=Morchella conica CCBAS932 TaxID=1392247 RepID=A0A3N4L0K6_9PEZI|nr:hypothetical protein P167DRAFT_532366 [Morchella conica CCBAS932]
MALIMVLTIFIMIFIIVPITHVIVIINPHLRLNRQCFLLPARILLLRCARLRRRRNRSSQNIRLLRGDATRKLVQLTGRHIGHLSQDRSLDTMRDC